MCIQVLQPPKRCQPRPPACFGGSCSPRLGLQHIPQTASLALGRQRSSSAAGSLKFGSSQWAGGEGRDVQLRACSDGFPWSVNAAAVHGLQTQGVLAMGAQSNCYTEITAKQVSVCLCVAVSLEGTKVLELITVNEAKPTLRSPPGTAPGLQNCLVKPDQKNRKRSVWGLIQQRRYQVG